MIFFRSITNRTGTIEKTKGETSKQSNSSKTNTDTRAKLRQISEPEVFSITSTYQHGTHSRSLSMGMNEISVQLEGILEEQEPSELERDDKNSDRSSVDSLHRSAASLMKPNAESSNVKKESSRSFSEVSTLLDQTGASDESNKIGKPSTAKKAPPKINSNAQNRTKRSAVRSEAQTTKTLEKALTTLLAKARAAGNNKTSCASFVNSNSYSFYSNSIAGRKSTTSESLLLSETDNKNTSNTKIEVRTSTGKISGTCSGKTATVATPERKGSGRSILAKAKNENSSGAISKCLNASSESKDRESNKVPHTRKSGKSTLNFSKEANASIPFTECFLKNSSEKYENLFESSAQLTKGESVTIKKINTVKNNSGEKSTGSKSESFEKSFSCSNLGRFPSGNPKTVKTLGILGSSKPPKSRSKSDGSGPRKFSLSSDSSGSGCKNSLTLPSVQLGDKEIQRDEETLKKLLNKMHADVEVPPLTASCVLDENSKSYYIKKILNSVKRREIQRILMLSDSVDKNLRESTAVNDYYDGNIQDDSFNLSASASTFIVDQKDVNTTREIHNAFISDSYPVSRRLETPLQMGSGNETFYCSPESGKLWGGYKVPKLDLSPLDSDTELGNEIRPNMHWDILVAVRSPVPSYKQQNINCYVPRLDVYDDSKSGNSSNAMNLNPFHGVTAPNPWEVIKPLENFHGVTEMKQWSSLDWKSSQLTDTAVAMAMDVRPPVNGFMRRYFRENANDFIRCYASDNHNSFEDASMLRPLSIVNWTTLSRPVLHQHFTGQCLPSEVNVEKPPSVKCCSRLKPRLGNSFWVCSNIPLSELSPTPQKICERSHSFVNE